VLGDGGAEVVFLSLIRCYLPFSFFFSCRGPGCCEESLWAGDRRGGSPRGTLRTGGLGFLWQSVALDGCSGGLWPAGSFAASLLLDKTGPEHGRTIATTRATDGSSDGRRSR
jgi:hypothetical protein